MAAPAIVAGSIADLPSTTAVSTLSPTWGATTVAGRYLYRYLVLFDGDVPHTVTTPAGWTQIGSPVQRLAAGLQKVTIYRYEIENASARSGAEAISWTGGACYAIAGLREFSGTVTTGVRDTTATSSNTGSAQIGDTGSTPATGQAEEYAIAIMGSGNLDAQTYSSGPSGGSQLAALNSGGSGSSLKGTVGIYGAALSTTQTVQFTAAIAGGFNHNYAAVVDTIKAPISGGGGGGGSDSLVSLLEDPFTRSGAGTLGTAPTGQTYALRSTAGDYGTDGDEATIDVPAAGSSRRATVNEISELDTDQTVTISCDELAVGANNEMAVGARISADGNTGYWLTVQLIPATDQVQWRLQAIEAGVTRTIGTVQTEAFTYVAGMVLKARFKVKGVNPATLSGKVWDAAGSEPAAFELVATDAGATLQAAGLIAAKWFVGTASTSAPVRFRLTNWSAARVVTGGATGNVTVTPSDRAVGAGGGGGGTPLPTGIGIRLGDQSSRSTWETLHGLGFDAKYMGIMVLAREVFTGPGTFKFYEPAQGPGSGMEDSVVHARLKGYKLGVRLQIGKESPAWWYTHATKPVGKITVLNSDANSNTGVPIDMPVPWDLPASSGSPHAPSLSGTNLRYWTQQLLTALAAWLDTSISDPLNPTQQIKRSALVAHVTVSMAAPEGTEMWTNYGTGSYTDVTTIRGYNLDQWQQWSSSANTPPAVVGNTVTKDQDNEDHRRADAKQAWLDSIVMWDDTLAPIGVASSIMYGAIFADNHRAARDIVATFEAGGENRARATRFYAGETNERANADSGGFILYDTGLDSSYNAVGVSRTTAPPRTWEGYASGPQNETLVRAKAAGCQMFLQSAAPQVFTSTYAGGSGAAAGFRAAMIDAIEVWHARWFETTTAMIQGNGGSIAASIQQATDAQIEQAGIAVTDGYTVGGGIGGGADSIVRSVRVGGGPAVYSRLPTDVAIGVPDTSPDDAVAVVRIPFIGAGGGVPSVPLARWRFVLCDTTGEPLADLSSIVSSRSLALGIGIPWGLSFQLPARSAEALLFVEGQTRVKGYRSGILRYHGEVWTCTDTLGGDGAETLVVQCWDPLQYLAVQFADAATNGVAVVKYSDQQMHVIARSLIRNAMTLALAAGAPFPLDYGTLVTGGGTPVRDRVFDPGTRLLTALHTLSERADGIEFVTRPVEGTILYAGSAPNPVPFEQMGIVDVSYPRLGGASAAVLSLGGSSGTIGQIERTRDLWGVVNEPVATGANFGGSGTRFGTARAPQSVRRFGRFARQTAFDNVKGKSRLEQLARGMLLPSVPDTYTITPNENGPRVFDDILIGDTVAVFVDAGRVQIDDTLRVTELTLSISDEGFEVGSAITVGEITPPEDVS